MKRMKFKVQYVPLSDEAINRHKDFDLLLQMYNAAPKAGWFQRYVKNRWTLFGSGLITGAILTSLFWIKYSDQKFTQPGIPESTSISGEMPGVNGQNNASRSTDSTYQFHTREALSINSPSKPADKSSSKEKSLSKNVHENNTGAGDLAVLKAPPLSNSLPAIQQHNDGKQEIRANNALPQSFTKANGQSIAVLNQNNKNSQANNYLQTDRKRTNNESILEKPELIKSVISFGDSSNVSENKSIALQELQNYMPSVNQEADTIAIKNDLLYFHNSSNEIDSGLPDEVAYIMDTGLIIHHPADTQKSSDTGSVKPAPENDLQPKGDTVNRTVLKLFLQKIDSTLHSVIGGGKDSSSHPFLNLHWHLFDKDSLRFLKRSNDLFTLQNDSLLPRAPIFSAADSSEYILRYAQVSFVTPLSSNGSEGYLYRHNISLNILQGFNGAVKGVEFGGLLNGDKGYVIGAQFGGLANYAGGDVKGAQFGGLANVAKSLKGAQFAGIANVSESTVHGFQAAGIVNIAADTLSGFQTAGVLNISGSAKKSDGWQTAGVGNISLGNLKGGQIAGVFNISNRSDGGQIGLINFGKKINGFQIGLINISDSITGIPIGLISLSAHGTFDINVWTSDVLTFNGGIRVGSEYVYNIFAYGISPFDATLPFGFGLGIGGHIPIKKAFIDMDGMAWTMHHQRFDFQGINMNNQFRLMGGYSFNKYFSLFAGPTYNVSVQNHIYDPYRATTFYTHQGNNTTVRMWVGFVAGIRMF
ncbi:MAG: hypothetical protein H0W62_14195 [Chitinophagales bacterium]|nr:hypothetical protein [Chitinophagales bacterium]